MSKSSDRYKFGKDSTVEEVDSVGLKDIEKAGPRRLAQEKERLAKLSEQRRLCELREKRAGPSPSQEECRKEKNRHSSRVAGKGKNALEDALQGISVAIEVGCESKKILSDELDAQIAHLNKHLESVNEYKYSTKK